MSAVAIQPTGAGSMPPCSWCGLRLSAGKHEGSDTCRECKAGGRVFRVKAYQQRLKRAAGEQR